MDTQAKAVEVEQPFRVKEELDKAGLRHGQTAIVTMWSVKITPHENPQVTACFMGGVKIVGMLDDTVVEGEIPRRVEWNVGMPGRDGVFNIHNIKVATNGVIRVDATAETEFELVRTLG